jgi:hypothetical protein
MKLLIWVGFIFSVVVALGLTGCSSRTPNIYQMDPGSLERIRSNIGRVGVTISSYPVERDLKKPAKGITGGAARGFVVGASTPIVIGAVAPVPGGTFIGLLIAPFTAVAGGVYGATKGVPPEDIEKAQAALDQAIDRLKKMNLRRTFIKEVVAMGENRTGLEFVKLPESGPKDPNEVVRYDQMNFRDVTYELRIWTTTQGPSGKLRYSRDGLKLPSHKLDDPLEPSIQYLWSVRARFMIDGDIRVTEWGMAGLPLRNESVPNLSCFRFKTTELCP